MEEETNEAVEASGAVEHVVETTENQPAEEVVDQPTDVVIDGTTSIVGDSTESAEVAEPTEVVE